MSKITRHRINIKPFHYLPPGRQYDDYVMLTEAPEDVAAFYDTLPEELQALLDAAAQRERYSTIAKCREVLGDDLIDWCDATVVK